MILICLLCSHTQKLPVTTVYTLWTIISLKSAVVDDFLANIKLEKVQISFYKIQKEKEYAKALLKGFSFEKSHHTILSSE